MNRRKNTGHWRTLFVGPDNARNDAVLRVAGAHALETGAPLLRVEDGSVLNEGRRYYRQFYYPLVMVSPPEDGDTLAWLRALAALGHLDTGFLLFFCGQPERFPLEYLQDAFPASRHLLLGRESPASVRAFLTLLPDLRHRRPGVRNPGPVREEGPT